MSTIFKWFLRSDEQVSIQKIITCLLSIIFIRIFFENFSNPDYSGYFYSWKDTYLQFPIYYTSVFVSFGLLLYLFTKKPITNILAFELKIFLFALLPPIVDLIVTKGKGAEISYILTEPQNFFSTFFYLMNPFGYKTVTIGVHTAAYFILAFMAAFVFYHTKSKWKSICIAALGYTYLFFYAITPSIIALPIFFQKSLNSILDAYKLTLNQSWLIQTALKNSFFSQSLDISATQNEPITATFFILLTIELLILFALTNKTFWKAFKKDLRLERIIYWTFISAIGMTISARINGNANFLNLINLLSLSVFVILIVLNAWLAVAINDREDIAIDQISNPERPLAKKVVSIEEWNLFSLILFILAAFGISTMNHSVTYLFIVAQVAYYIYSSKPLRFKRHFISSSLLIGIASVAMSMAGFFLISPDQHIKAFPVSAIWMIGISFALISNIKDLKDYEGDKFEQIKTLPVVFGLKQSKKIMAGLFAIVFFAVPYLLKSPSLFPISIAFWVLIFHNLTKKQYQEKNLFAVLFAYMAAMFFLI